MNMLNRIVAAAFAAFFSSIAFAQPQTVTTTANQTITGAKTFSGSCKVLLAGATSGTTCLNAPAIAGSTTAIVFPGAAGTLATLAGTETLTNKSIVYTQLTGLGTGVQTWFGTPTGANLMSILGCSGTATFLRADGTCAVAGSSSASDLTSGTLDCAREPAYTGDVTTSAGSCANTLANIPTAVPVAGYMLHTNIAAPSTPASGKTSVWADSTSKTLKAINDAGTLSTTVIADTGSSSNFLTAISAAGVISKAQPAFSDLSGSVAAAQLPNPSSSTLGGTQSHAAVSHEFLTAISTSGVPAGSQPAFTDISGTVSTSQLANNAVTNAKAAQMSSHTFKGNNTGSTADPLDLTATQLTAELTAVVGDSGSGGTKGMVPAPAAGDAAANKFLGASGSFASIPGVAGASLALLEQHAASSSATLDFTSCISSTYDEYQIEFVNVVPATTATQLWMRMSTDGGSTYDTSSVYSYGQFAWNSATALAAATLQSKMILTISSVHNSSSWGITGSAKLYSPGSATLFKQVDGILHIIDSASARSKNEFFGAYESATAVNAFRFLMSSGNISTGTIRCYGIAKSEAELDPLFDAITRMASNDAPRTAANDDIYQMAA